MATGFGFRYGLYPFVAENEDEISFQPGEKIEILEQDDQYGDGWWQVCLSLLSSRVELAWGASLGVPGAGRPVGQGVRSCCTAETLSSGVG